MESNLKRSQDTRSAGWGCCNRLGQPVCERCATISGKDAIIQLSVHGKNLEIICFVKLRLSEVTSHFHSFFRIYKIVSNRPTSICRDAKTSSDRFSSGCVLDKEHCRNQFVVHSTSEHVDRACTFFRRKYIYSRTTNKW
eukprot:Lithocolla_globosa_v1_NODE_8287_length_838_cov_22.644955.p2 type:complete len:139 gc:universal NODE_8287_length_838_cov_22.644955:482-66(-)